MTAYRTWKRFTHQQISDRVFTALESVVDFRTQPILGLPASSLDKRVFFDGATFLRDAPFISTLVRNPNHIGCHTFGTSERHFRGTHEIERDVIRICSEDILGSEADQCDGYVASGGTEANIQAIWVYRNYFQREKDARSDEIKVIVSSDAHYSISKACNLLGLERVSVQVNELTREMEPASLDEAIQSGKRNGARYWIVIANMGTTMFGSVDAVDRIADHFEAADATYRLHVDGAFGGFVYPFTGDSSEHSFKNPRVSSISLDAHKVLQAPYGTGIFLARKGLLQYVSTTEADYVDGFDSTLIGSRSGANAIAIWMILMTYGPHGWEEKIMTLQDIRLADSQRHRTLPQSQNECDHDSS
jgi:tyrosine decarboxylase / aspartate 1-decarboxylase